MSEISIAVQGIWANVTSLGYVQSLAFSLTLTFIIYRPTSVRLKNNI